MNDIRTLAKDLAEFETRVPQLTEAELHLVARVGDRLTLLASVELERRVRA